MTKCGAPDMIKEPAGQAGQKRALLHKRRLAHRLNPMQISAGGGGAYVEETDFHGSLFLGGYGNTHVPVGHKCVLTARLQPERSTLMFD